MLYELVQRRIISARTPRLQQMSRSTMHTRCSHLMHYADDLDEVELCLSVLTSPDPRCPVCGRLAVCQLTLCLIHRPHTQIIWQATAMYHAPCQQSGPRRHHSHLLGFTRIQHTNPKSAELHHCWDGAAKEHLLRYASEADRS